MLDAEKWRKKTLTLESEKWKKSNVGDKKWKKIRVMFWQKNEEK